MEELSSVGGQAAPSPCAVLGTSYGKVGGVLAGAVLHSSLALRATHLCISPLKS